MSEFARSASSPLLLKNVLPAAKNLLNGMVNQGGFKHMLLKQTKNAFNSYPDPCSNLNKYKECF